MVINHLLNGMILQVPQPRGGKKVTTCCPGYRPDFLGLLNGSLNFENLERA